MISLGEFLYSSNSVNSISICSDFTGKENKITDIGVGILTPYILGNMSLKTLNIAFNAKITNNSVPHFVEMATKTYIECINIEDTSVSGEQQYEINELLEIPTDDRAIPIASSTKSAAKSYPSLLGSHS